MSPLEERVQRLEGLIGRVFRPGGTLPIRDAEGEPATIIVGDVAGDIGSVLMSFGLSVKEPSDERRIVVTSAGIGIKDDKDMLRILITEMGILFLDETGEPKTLISADGVRQVAEPTRGRP